MELWDLYDKGRAPLHRTHPRGAPLPEGAYHVAVEVAVFNPQGEVLLTRRAPEKEKHPGCWEITGGAVLAGEDSLTAACRELWEETGIRVQPQELTLLGTECVPRVFLDIYAVKKPVPPFPAGIPARGNRCRPVDGLLPVAWPSRQGSVFDPQLAGKGRGCLVLPDGSLFPGRAGHVCATRITKGARVWHTK